MWYASRWLRALIRRERTYAVDFWQSFTPTQHATFFGCFGMIGWMGGIVVRVLTV